MCSPSETHHAFSNLRPPIFVSWSNQLMPHTKVCSPSETHHVFHRRGLLVQSSQSRICHGKEWYFGSTCFDLEKDCENENISGKKHFSFLPLEDANLLDLHFDKHTLTINQVPFVDAFIRYHLVLGKHVPVVVKEVLGFLQQIQMFLADKYS